MRFINAIFLSKFSKKCLRTTFLACFSKVFRRARKINSVDLKNKGRQNLFLKIRPLPPLENPRSASGLSEV